MQNDFCNTINSKADLSRTSRHIDGTHVPVEEPSTASVGDIGAQAVAPPTALVPERSSSAFMSAARLKP